MWKIKQFFSNIKRLIDYFPIIWSDRNYDHWYIDKLILFKLKKQYDYLVLKKYPIIDWKYHKKEAHALKLCIAILERRVNYWYDSTYYYLIDQDLKFVPVDDYTSQLDSTRKISSDMRTYNKKSKYANLIEVRDWKLYNKLYQEYQQCWWD